MRICIFGASITWGAWDPENFGWAGRLRKFLETNKKYEDIEVYNLAISGTTTRDLIKTIKLECDAIKPNIIVIAIGTNDASYINSKENFWTDFKKFKSNINKLIKITKKLDSKTIFLGITNVDEKRTMPSFFEENLNGYLYYSNSNIEKYNSAIEKICQKEKISFIQVFGMLNDNEFEDGLHPNSKGHEKMFQKIKYFLISNRII